MLKFTVQNQKKVQAIFEALEYTVRYEKGNFQSGYCLVEAKKILIVNKFFDTEGKINCLLDILGKIQVDADLLDEANLKFYQKILPVVRGETPSTADDQLAT